MRLLYVVNQAGTFFTHRLPWAMMAQERGHEVHVAGPIANRDSDFRDHGFIPHDFPFVRGFGSPTKQARALSRFQRILHKVRPDMVHLVGSQIIASLGPLTRGIPFGERPPNVVGSVTGLGHAFLTDGPKGRLMRAITVTGYALTAHRAGTTFVFQNRDDQATLRAYRPLRDLPSSLIPGSGVDVTQFPFRPRAATDLPVVALPARLLREKGVREFVAAAKRLRAEGVSARFVLVGGVDMGNPSAVTEAELTNWTKQGLVEWWGHSNDMCATYGDCDVVVLPSYREGLPKALLEAAAMGRPLVATDVPGCREVVRHEQNGLLVPLQDEQALAQAMHRLITDAALRQQFAAAGRRMVEAEWSAEIISNQYCDLYERLQRRSR